MLASHGSERRHPENRENQTARLLESISDVREQFQNVLPRERSIEHATSMSLAPSGDPFVWPDDCAH
jgi:trehalose-6-phosphatase